MQVLSTSAYDPSFLWSSRMCTSAPRAFVPRADSIVIVSHTPASITGHTQGLEPLIGDLGVLDEYGRPVVSRGHQAPGAPGMWFIGYTNPISGNLRELRIDSGRIAHAMRRQAAAEQRATA